LIRACGAVELAFKAVVADFCSRRSKQQVKRYLSTMVRGSSRNPSYTNICKLLKEFDPGWNLQFKAALASRPDFAQLTAALTSLVDARNDFAHGGSPTITLGDVQLYFGCARTVVEQVDVVVG
jgi:hypothetical protein